MSSISPNLLLRNLKEFLALDILNEKPLSSAFHRFSDPLLIFSFPVSPLLYSRSIVSDIKKVNIENFAGFKISNGSNVGIASLGIQPCS